MDESGSRVGSCGEPLAGHDGGSAIPERRRRYCTESGSIAVLCRLCGHKREVALVKRRSPPTNWTIRFVDSATLGVSLEPPPARRLSRSYTNWGVLALCQVPVPERTKRGPLRVRRRSGAARVLTCAPVGLGVQIGWASRDPHPSGAESHGWWHTAGVGRRVEIAVHEVAGGAGARGLLVGDVLIDVVVEDVLEEEVVGP
jgi:hypothetical protein